MLHKIFCLLCLLFLTGTSARSQEPRPNILWLTFEDTSPEFIGIYGSLTAKTPTMDQLAWEGVRFNYAFSTGSVCSPSRSALITGVKTYELGTGNHRSGYPIPDFIHGFPKYLKDAGYYTTNNSKTDYNTSDAQRIIAESWDESSGKAGWWNRAAGQPFFAVFNSMSSHQSRTMTLPYPDYEKLVLSQLPDSMKHTDASVFMPPYYRDSPEMRKQMARVDNSISKTDLEFRELLDRLDKEGLRQNTIIFLFADHGEGMPRSKTNGIGLGHRVPFVIWFPEKYKHLSPWGTSGAVTDEMIDFTDLPPTVLALAGVKIPDYMQGRVLAGEPRQPAPKYLYLSSDRSDESYDLTRTVIQGKYAYSRVFVPYIQELRHLLYMDMGEITHQIRQDYKAGKLTASQRQMLEPRPAEFLYDLEKDPWEMNNLAEDPAYSKLIATFRQVQEKEILTQKDILFLPEYEIEQISKTTTPYEYRAQLDLKPIYDMARWSGFRTEKAKVAQMKGLESKNQLVRYWALQGLKSNAKALGEKEKAALAPALDDPYPPTALWQLRSCRKSRIRKNPTKYWLTPCNPPRTTSAIWRSSRSCTRPMPRVFCRRFGRFMKNKTA
ncbi:sulfatase family protein [Salmonirosea aquatica]|uniref:sulfatase family protein n=1 Tax=Salmonirosea aquatica TaxID=2654236 RepID=UPI003570DBE5